ncbi:MAG TPA: SRPBCC family protein [Natronosporangium sp.]
MKDIINELTGVHREVGTGRIPAGEGKAVKLRRTYDAPIEDVWEAITTAERISRWFLPISGDLQLGGKYQLEGNAGGEILACDKPTFLKVTWVFGENPSETDISEVEVRLQRGERDTTVLELTHTAVVPDDRWNQFGPGAVGVGWDGVVAGLALYLKGHLVEDPAVKEQFPFTPEGREFYTKSSKAWAEAFRAAGATAEQAATAEQNTTAFYAPPPDAPQPA